MSGYTPVFDSVFQGTLCGKYPDLPVWLVLLALQQRGGIIDAHPSYIATVSGLPQADIELAISHFCQPDQASRTPDNDGRRLEPIEGRGFGWRVVNHERYREKARKQAYDENRTATGADAARKAAERNASRAVPTSPDASRAVPLSEAEADAESEAFKNSEKRKKPPAARASALDPDFELTLDRKAYAEKTLPNVDAPELMAAFRDYHASKGTTAKDWDAAWRTYVRNGLKFGYPMLTPVASQAPPPPIVRYDSRGRVRHDL